MSDPDGTPASDRPEASTEERPPRDAGSPGDVPDPQPPDDGAVPDKWIRRWKGEGGALHPND